MAKSLKINREIKIHEVVKVKAPIVEALRNAVEHPTYQFHIPGHTKGRAVLPEFKKLIGEKAGEKAMKEYFDDEAFAKAVISHITKALDIDQDITYKEE